MLEERSTSLTLIFVVCLVAYCHGWKRIYYDCGMKTVEKQTSKEKQTSRLFWFLTCWKFHQQDSETSSCMLCCAIRKKKRQSCKQFLILTQKVLLILETLPPCIAKSEDLNYWVCSCFPSLTPTPLHYSWRLCTGWKNKASVLDSRLSDWNIEFQYIQSSMELFLQAPFRVIEQTNDISGIIRY